MVSKTCYFCKPVGKKECDACTNVTKSNFVGNADWLYIEGLEKENEELKKENSRWKMIDAKIEKRKFYITSDFDFISAVLIFWYKLTRKICKYYGTKGFFKCEDGLCQYYQIVAFSCKGYCGYTNKVI